MKRIEGADVAEDLFGAGKDGFTSGEPGIEAATVVTDAWLNEAQEEIVSLIEAAGLTPNVSTTQLREAIAAMAWVFTGFVKFSNSSGVAAIVGSMRSAGEFRYCDATGALQAREKIVMLPLSTAGNANWTSISSALVSVSPDRAVDIPLPVSSSCWVKRVRVAYKNNGTPSSPPSFLVIAKEVDKTGTPGIGTLHEMAKDTDPGGTAGTTSSTPQTMATPNMLSSIIDLGQAEWFVSIWGTGLTGDAIYWVEATIVDSGPTNF